MKIGLLACDRVNEEFLSIQGDYPDMFRNLFQELSFEVFRVHENHFPQSADAFDAYLVTGSRFSVYDPVDWIFELKQFVQEIRHTGKTYIGVCFGHQLLAEALGGKVARAETGWCIGSHEYEILHREPWMDPLHTRLNLLMMCQDQVVDLPPDSTLLARTTDCPVGMFTVRNHMLGIQAHPEFSKAYNEALSRSRVERIGTQKVEQGIASLSNTVHDQVFRHWVLKFLTRSHLKP